jgi:hypothetical protein
VSSFPVAVLMRFNFIIELVLIRIDWHSCLKVMMDCCFSLLIWAVLGLLPNRCSTPTWSQHNWLFMVHWTSMGNRV